MFLKIKTQLKPTIANLKKLRKLRKLTYILLKKHGGVASLVELKS